MSLRTDYDNSRTVPEGRECIGLVSDQNVEDSDRLLVPHKGSHGPVRVFLCFSYEILNTCHTRNLSGTATTVLGQTQSLYGLGVTGGRCGPTPQIHFYIPHRDQNFCFCLSTKDGDSWTRVGPCYRRRFLQDDDTRHKGPHRYF